MNTQAIVTRKNAELKIYPSLSSGGKPIVANMSEKFVLMNDFSWPNLKGCVREFCTLLDEALTEFFLSPSCEVALNAAVSRVEKYSGDDIKKNLRAPYLLRLKGYRVWKHGSRVPYFSFVYHDDVCRAVDELREAKIDDFPAIRGMEILEASYSAQRQAAVQILRGGGIRDMAWARAEWGLSNVCSERLRELVKGSTGPLGFLEKICCCLRDWMDDAIDARQRGDLTSEARSKTRPFALAWFAMWFAEQGNILFPLSYSHCGTEFIPRFWRSIRHSFLPKDARQSWEAMELQVGMTGHQKCFDGNTPVGAKGASCMEQCRCTTSFLRLTSSWRGVDQVSADFFRDLFGHVPKGIKYYMLVLWDNGKSKCIDVPAVDLRDEEAKLRSRKARPRSGPRAGRLWPWVDSEGDYEPYRNEKHFIRGFKAGPNMLSHVGELRDLLPKIVGKSVSTWSASLSVWLRYLATLPDKQVPARLLDIDRNTHIDAPNDPSKLTLCKFEREMDLPKTLRPRIYHHLESAWSAAYELASPENRPATKVCPILVRFDAPRVLWTNRVQTHRRPLDEEILHFLIAVNRRNDFQFSRERRKGRRGLVDYRRVTDSTTGYGVYEWFPGSAVLMDVLLNIPLRKKQGRYLDSGEGDECSLNIETLVLTPNTRPTAQPGRRSAFFCRRSISMVEDKPVLGMFVNTNKTGRPYTIPWLPLEVARNVQSVIDWQGRFNPINQPVPDRDYSPSNRGGTDIFDEPVWPIFRDPGDPGNEPVSDGKLNSYFVALMEYCEKEFNQGTGRNISLFAEDRSECGKIIRRPIIDLHSLRVTGVTVLIENGVPVEVVQQLVGHSSIAMTCYYYVVESRKVHEELVRALEARAVTVERLQKMSSEEFREFSGKFAFNRSADPSFALEIVTGALRNRNPGWDLKYHGICAAGDCRFGGELDGNGEPTPLWRAEACSLCRYRVTGAPWLVGLVHHLNELWYELSECSRNVVELQVRRDRAEDEGRSLKSILGDLERMRLRRDNLVNEWANEFRYVEQAKSDLDKWVRWSGEDKEGAPLGTEGGLVPLRSPMEGPEIQVQLTKVHRLSHLTELLRGSRILASAILPRGVKEDRNALLLEIARVSQDNLPFLTLMKCDAEHALDLFADVILDEVSDPDELEDIVQGRTPISRYPRIRDKVSALLDGENRVANSDAGTPRLGVAQ
ncbi:tyrosine-type recombinase/integrase [Rhodanobacter glycinis]|uniref:Tyrosine-type recombinase/integrase n=1 Tax=Rhodanobacter glycinis TaxID=582702 RepID=A0A5B9E2C2_9GAMM|nr:VPA1269 family protein [Rhodanobacter glycinis]QEE24397.1 tyrosine-type recombinase/integrase [Rhodanobacter glycinis]